MKNNKMLIIIGGLIAIILIVVAIFLPSEKEEEVKEDLLGISYDVEGNEASLKYYTENNFISLVKSGFYDKNSFHRLEPGFVLQGGDPSGNGTGGPGYSIKGEFTDNGFENNLKHEKWVLSMARSQDNDSAGSQFFIMLDKSEYLDGKYASFGKVIDGFKNIENIVSNERVTDSSTGKLANNLVIKKSIIDLKGKTYPEVEKIEE